MTPLSPMSLTAAEIESERAMWLTTMERSRERKEKSDYKLAERYVALCDLALAQVKATSKGNAS